MRLSRKACFWWTQLLRPFCRAADEIYTHNPWRGSSDWSISIWSDFHQSDEDCSKWAKAHKVKQIFDFELMKIASNLLIMYYWKWANILYLNVLQLLFTHDLLVIKWGFALLKNWNDYQYKMWIHFNDMRVRFLYWYE